MSDNQNNRTNILGDVRAEHDHAMLDMAFYEWQGYKSLIEADDRYVVVGRRGTGKSALTYRLMKDCEARKDFVIVVKPDEEELIGLRAVAAKYGSTVSRVRSAIKIGWRYALIMEIAANLNRYYKTSQSMAASQLKRPLKEWEGRGNSIIRRLHLTLKASLLQNESSEESITELPHRLKIEELNQSLSVIVQGLNKRIVILIDRLDEGYEPDDIGIGIVDGIIYGTEEIRTKLPQTKAAVNGAQFPHKFGVVAG